MISRRRATAVSFAAVSGATAVLLAGCAAEPVTAAPPLAPATFAPPALAASASPTSSSTPTATAHVVTLGDSIMSDVRIKRL